VVFLLAHATKNILFAFIVLQRKLYSFTYNLKMKKLNIIFLSLVSIFSTTLEAQPEYNTTSKILLIPAIDVDIPSIDESDLTDVKFKLNESGLFDFISYSTENRAYSNDEDEPERPSYDDYLKFMTLPSVKIGNEYVYDAKLLQKKEGEAFSIVGYFNEPAIACTAEMLTIDKFNQLGRRMSLKQVRDIFGCREKSEPSVPYDDSDYDMKWRIAPDIPHPAVNARFLNGRLVSWIFSDAHGEITSGEWFK
jgi:hypothetical protein